MKKLLTIVVAILLSAVSLMASNTPDIIITTNSEKIEAFIQEVSDVEIRYKKANNPNGPTFILKTENVSSIIYSNGEVQAIEHKTPEKTSSAYSPFGVNNGGYGYSNTTTGPMRHIGNDTYTLDGQTTLRGKELKYFLQQNCPHAYNYYKTFSDMETAGAVMMGSGTVMCLVMGLTMMACAQNYSTQAAGFSFMIIGAVTAGVSIPLVACGNVYKKRVDNVYNTYCAERRSAYNLELKLNASQNGIGLALGF